ncbi:MULTISPECIES: GDSL-type esterase/lipase family protein [Leuconostoc]|uniref:Lysophospholipase n=1 Tax=Leuconostoc garlicum TaxID=255248 RepID=A0ABM6HU18_9LACO|nr:MULTISPECIES: GDSL-type esterase/lipase family protein [Leuconostoc]AQN79863.1 lysophospholipase [Leuconostoc garlicum]MDN2648863.1 GDSL-type esterase/lipase family protein [Leuconostoc lactis]GEB39784.1 endoglucanase [Leuconostoc lactis]GLY44892.1 endoglucanase [Leuconostoc lactis]HCH60790.1 lysophospholipase [Leuconostoc lactis]
MKTVDMTRLLSPEWGVTDDGMMTTQFGASVAFVTTHVHVVRLSFAKNYDGLTFAVQINAADWQEMPVTDQTLQVTIPTETAEVRMVLRDRAGSSEAFWQDPVYVTAVTIDQGEVAPIENVQPYVTFVGDSITAGEAMAADGHHPELSYPQLVADALGQPLARIAYGGTGLTAAAPYQIPTAIEALWHVGDNVSRPLVTTNLVLVNYGTNDFNYGATPTAFAFGLRIYLLELIKRFHNAKIILMMPLNGAFREVFLAETARFDQFTLIETKSWLPAMTDVHPNCAAHQIIAEQIVKGL